VEEIRYGAILLLSSPKDDGAFLWPQMTARRAGYGVNQFWHARYIVENLKPIIPSTVIVKRVQYEGVVEKF
jgi:hypothetical protein